MNKQSDVVVDTQPLDREWLVLIAAAKALELSQAEILAFLRRGTTKEESKAI